MSEVISSIAQPVDTGVISDMTFLLKVMQTVVAILTPPSPPMHQDDLARALGVCFQLRLRAQRLPGLHQPAEASLRQIFSTIFDRTWELYSARLSGISTATDVKEVSSASKDKIPSSEKPKPSECDLCILDATRLLRDIVYLAGGEQAVWLSLTALDPNFCLELLEEFLTEHRQLALKCPEFTSIVKDRISALLLALLDHRKDIGFMIRLLRNCVAFLGSFHMLQPMHCVTILASFRSLLVPSTQPFWVQVLMLETFRWLCKDSDSLLHKIVLEDDGLLRDKPQLLEAFIKFIGKLGRYVTTTIAKLETGDFIAKVTKPRFIDQLTYLDISSQMTGAHAVTLALTSFVSFTDTMAHLIAPFDTQAPPPSSPSPQLNRVPSKNDHLQSSTAHSSSSSISTFSDTTTAHSETVYRVNQKICDSAWPSVLASLSVVLSKTKDESLIQSSLKAYQSFTNTLGVLKLSGPRGAFLDSLVKFSLPFSVGPAQSLPTLPPSPNITAPTNNGLNQSASSAHSAQSSSHESSPLFHFSLLAEDQYKNCRFTKKNIAAMKTVLNVAHCMGSILDTNWNIMVETLNHLNGILACTRRVRNVSVIMSSSSASSFSSTGSGVGSPMDDESVDSNLSSSSISRNRPISPAVSQYDLNTQDSSLSAQDWPTREEIDILDSALDSLFSTSVYISDAGFIDFANALISLSMAQFGSLSENTTVKPFHLFGLTSLMKLLRYNARRASLVWTSVHEHMLFACNFPNGGARQLSVRAICGTIEEGVAIISKPPYETLGHDDPTYVALILMQVRYLETIQSLVEARHEQTRVEILDSLHRILQHSGSALSTGWPVVLAILLNIGVSNEMSLIPLGFKSVQAITNEYLSALPYDCLPVTISTIGNFGGKSIADININIAAIGLLWNVADFIARKHSDILSEARKAQGIAEEGLNDTNSSTGAASGDATNVDASKSQPTYVDSLWLALFQELAARVDNQRSEIRDCALATLYGILTTYGASLNVAAWQTLIERHLLPSLPWVLKQVQLATREPDDKDAHQAMTATSNLHPAQPTNPALVSSSTLNNSHSSPHLSSSTSSAANIVIHHSRNTLAKQWQETQVSLLANLSRVFKAFLRTTLAKFSNAFFEKLYSVFLDHVELFAKNASLEVAVQCVSAVRDMLIAVYSGVDVFKSESILDAGASQSLSPSTLGLESHAWRTWQRIANHIGATRTHARLVGHFVDGLEEIFNLLTKKQCDALRIERVVSVIQPLLYLPLELAGEYTVLHKQVFPMLSSFALPSSPHARYSLALLPKLVSVCLTYISNAIGYRYHSACYCPRSLEICHQLDEPVPAADDLPSNVTPRSHNLRGSKNSFVSDRGSWNVNPASLEKNFFNLADKSINMLQQIWDALSADEYALKCEKILPCGQVEATEERGEGKDSSTPSPFLSVEQIHAASQQISLQIFPDIVSVLGHAVQAKPLDPRAKFWAPSLDLFMKSIREILSKLDSAQLVSHSSSTELLALQPRPESEGIAEPEKPELPVKPASPSRSIFTAIEINIIWTGIIDSIESFLMVGSGVGAETSSPSSGYGSHYMGSSSTAHMSSYGSSISSNMSPSVSNESLSMSTLASEARLVELLSHHLLYICPTLPNLHDRLFQILVDGCEMVHREALMKQCYASLFDAVHSSQASGSAIPNDTGRAKVSKLALPQLMKRCQVVLSKFVADDKRSGALPLPSGRVVEITFLLEQLKALRVHPSLWDKPPKALPESSRRHLWELFPLLCECITAKEVELKTVIKSVFLEFGEDLGLEQMGVFPMP